MRRKPNIYYHTAKETAGFQHGFRWPGESAGFTRSDARGVTEIAGDGATPLKTYVAIRDRTFVDSLLEENGFELPVPLTR